MLTTVGRIFIVPIDKRGHTNAAITRSLCGEHNAVQWSAAERHYEHHVNYRRAWLCYVINIAIISS